MLSSVCVRVCMCVQEGRACCCRLALEVEAQLAEDHCVEAPPLQQPPRVAEPKTSSDSIPVLLSHSDHVTTVTVFQSSCHPLI